MVPTLPNEVHGAIQHLIRRGVKKIRSSRLRRLINLQKKHNKMLDLVLPQKKRK